MRRIVIILGIFFLTTLLVEPSYSAVVLQRVHLKAVGDIMVHDVQYNSAYNWQTGEYDFMPMFRAVADDLKADLLVGNLETTFGGPERGYSGYPRFNSPDNLAKILAKLGFNMLFTANNHSLDTGEDGLRRTVQVLDNNKIMHTGTFLSKEDLEKPRILSANGMSFGFLNYTYGTNGLKIPQGKEYLVNTINLKQIQNDLNKLRPLVDIVVVGLHFGNEYWQSPSNEQKHLAYEVAKAGADIILGSHPHVLQPFEFIEVDDRKCFVVYSLGNFVSGQKQRYTDGGAVLDIIIEKSVLDQSPQIVKIDYTPVWVRRYNNLGRMKLEVLPLKDNITGAVPLTLREVEKANQVINDVNNIWAPLEASNNFNRIFSNWANIYVPLTDPKLWVPTMLYAQMSAYEKR